ncbi:hypothetical protein PsorP6_015948 [Peronosclerospora sorghi]|uniref:Uncharacterized protein n=1 Tax=Peronosclerospora sorghi TaxID=230839 RepID=A0ACC0WNV8_9STRA|nr:hypothetical protein PsorP6_015948 [Peronosclerospora sorghi]
MLRRHSTRVEERADVAAEYEAYLQEKERKVKNTNDLQQPQEASTKTMTVSMTGRKQARLKDVRARIGLESFP